MWGSIHRRGLLSAAAATVAGPALITPAWAHAPGVIVRGRKAAVSAYYERLRSRIGDAGGGRFLPEAEDALLGEHNQFRAGQHLGGLQRHDALNQAARAHAADMIERDYFAHEAPEGYSSVQRVGLLARSFIGLAGENIVESRGGPPVGAAELAGLWRDSPGHRANMLRSTYTHIGFGVARKGDRTVAAAAFGEAYAELAEPLAFRIGGLGGIVWTLAGNGAQGAPVRGFALEPVDGGRPLGPFWLEDPAPEIATGAYSIKPYLADVGERGRFIIVDGPIIEAEG
jgi:uncharacterized protein YkwD